MDDTPTTPITESTDKSTQGDESPTPEQHETFFAALGLTNFPSRGFNGKSDGEDMIIPVVMNQEGKMVVLIEMDASSMECEVTVGNGPLSTLAPVVVSSLLAQVAEMLLHPEFLAEWDKA